MYKSARDIYDMLAHDYDCAYHSLIHRVEDDYIYSLLHELEFDKGHILDLGCGTGEAAKHFQNHDGNFRYFGIDISSQMVDVAKQKAISFFNNSMDDYRFSVQDMSRLTYLNNSIDNVISLFGSFSYCRKPRVVVEEILRILKPGGRFFIMAMSQRYKTRPSYILNRLNIQSPAVFYNSQHLKSLFSKFSNVRITGMTLFSEALSKKFPHQKKIITLFHSLETKSLGQLFPDKCYFLIITGRKHDK